MAGRWLPWARAGVVLALVLILALFLAGIPVMSREVAMPCSGASCYRWEPTPELVHRLLAGGTSLHLYAAYYVAVESVTILGSCLIGIVLILRRPDEPMALFAAFTIATFSSAFSDAIVALSLASPLAWALRTLLAMLGWASLFIPAGRPSLRSARRRSRLGRQSRDPLRCRSASAAVAPLVGNALAISAEVP